MLPLRTVRNKVAADSRIGCQLSADAEDLTLGHNGADVVHHIVRPQSFTAHTRLRRHIPAYKISASCTYEEMIGGDPRYSCDGIIGGEYRGRQPELLAVCS